MDNKEKILIASTNLGKINIYKQVCDELGLETVSLLDLNVDVKVDETGKDEIENATLKAVAYHKATGLPVIANDSGLIIDKFSQENQPGVLVRRYNDKELTDEQLLNLYIEKLNEVDGESSGHYDVGLAIIDKDGNLYTKMFYPERFFTSKPSLIMKKGVPLASLCFYKEMNKYESEMTIKERNDCEKEAMQQQKAFIESVFVKNN